MSTTNNSFSSIPDVKIPNAAFRPYVLHGNVLHISGQLPVREGKPAWVGQVPDVVSVMEAQKAMVGRTARSCSRLHLLDFSSVDSRPCFRSCQTSLLQIKTGEFALTVGEEA